jgi:hypothetical protein
VYNLAIVYQTKFFPGNKLLHYTLDGWSVAPLFTAQSGAPLEVNIGSGTSDCQSFGESNCSSDSTYENAVTVSKYTGGNSLSENVAGNATTKVGTSGNPATGGSGLNIFSDPNAIYNEFGRLVLGVNTNSNGAGILRNFPTWNLDMQLSKDFVVPKHEGIGLTFNAQFLNMLNHFQAGTPSLNIDSPTTWGPARQTRLDKWSLVCVCTSNAFLNPAKPGAPCTVIIRIRGVSFWGCKKSATINNVAFRAATVLERLLCLLESATYTAFSSERLF